MRSRNLVGIALGLAAALAICQVVVGGKGAGGAAAPKAKAEPEPGKGKRAQDFIAAFNRGDAKATASFWMPEATYVDVTGRETKGQAAIQKLYEKLFAEQKGAKLTVTVLSARLIAPEVALEDGLTEINPADGGPGSVARFSAVLVKKDGEWYFESVRESVARPPSNVEHFEDIEWLIGNWTGENDKGMSGTASFAWAENQNFIVSSFATTLNGIPIMGGTQWIGWDAIDKDIKSWSFYSGGGTGQAVWKKAGDTWTLTTMARTADGKKVSGVNIVTKLSADRATWQMTKVTVDGEPKPDPEPLKLKRVKPAQP